MRRISRKLTLMVLIIFSFTLGTLPGKFSVSIGGISTVAAAANISSQDGIGYSGSYMTREETIVVITRALQMVGVEVALSDDKVKQILGRYGDADKVSGWAENAVAVAIETGLLQGKTTHTLASQDPVTRAETVIMIRRMLEYANLI